MLDPSSVAELGTEVRCGALHPGGLVAGGTEDGTVILARAGRVVTLGAPRVHGAPVAALRFASDGQHLLSAGGELAVWWATARGKLERQVKGPQQITAALLVEEADGPVAYLGTALGAMVRWPVRDSVSRPIRELACPALPVPVERRGLPEAQRCPYGEYVEAEDGSGAACVYPVTALGIAGSTLWRACREDPSGGQDQRTRKWLGFGVGFLHSLAVRQDGTLLLGRDDGDLRLLDVDHRERVGELQPRGVAQVMDAAGDLIAVAQGQRVRIFVGASRQPSAEFALTGRAAALALRLSPLEIRTLTAEGTAEVRPLRRR